MFFQKETNKNIINKFLSNGVRSKINNLLEGYKKSNDYDKLLEVFDEIFTSMLTEPNEWDKYTPINIDIYGEDLLANLKRLTEKVINSETIDLSDDIVLVSILTPMRILCLDSLRFLCERDFRYKSNNGANTDPSNDFLNKVKQTIINCIVNDDFDEKFKLEILYIIHSTPHLITKDLFHSDQIKLFSTFEEKKLTVEKILNNIANLKDEITIKISDFQTELEKKETTVKNLKKALDEQETAFNFVGLYDGFKQLLRIKIKESRVLLGLLVAMGCMMIIPLLCTIFGWLPENILKAEEPISHLLKLVPFISLEILLIYFFRVILQNYKSVKGQILQIELRQTLCQFIQNYADYSKEIRTNDSHPLEKFENLIFSGIISDAENLPSTFDGMDQIGKLFSTLKAKG